MDPSPATSSAAPAPSPPPPPTRRPSRRARWWWPRGSCARPCWRSCSPVSSQSGWEAFAEVFISLFAREQVEGTEEEGYLTYYADPTDPNNKMQADVRLRLPSARPSPAICPAEDRTVYVSGLAKVKSSSYVLLFVIYVLSVVMFIFFSLSWSYVPSSRMSLRRMYIHASRPLAPCRRPP